MFEDFLAVLDDNPFEEYPVDVRTFVQGKEYLGLPQLSELQYEIVEAMSQIYRVEDLKRFMPRLDAEIFHKKYTKTEIILRLGKGCHVGSDEIYNPLNGQWIRHDDMTKPNNYVMGLDGVEYATEAFSKGIERVYEVTTAKGFRVTVSADHKFMTKTGEVKLSELSCGDRILISGKLDIINPVPMPLDELKILAYWLGDGSMPSAVANVINMDFLDNDVLAMEEYLDIFRRNGDSPTVTHHPTKNMWFVRHHSQKDKYAHSLIEKYKLFNKKAGTKEIPKEIFSLPDDQLGIFIGRLWGTDGCIYGKANRHGKRYAVAEYTTISKSMATDLHRLLVRFGIVSSLRSRKPTYTYNGERKVGKTAYHITIADGVGMSRFLVNVKLLDKKNFWKVARGYNTNYDGDFYWDSIKSIKEVGSEEVFTTTATETHFYNAGMIMNGNSGK